MAAKKTNRRCRKVKGRGLITRALKGVGNIAGTVLNKGIDLLPFEAHIPGYSYCGPGTKLKERLSRGDRPINGLDEACRTHDIAYSKYSDSARRARADSELAEKAWQRFKAKDSSVGEKAAAWTVTTAMKAKAKLGAGRRKRRTKKSQKGKGMYLRPWAGTKARGGSLGGKRRKRCRRQKKKKILI